MHKTEVNFILEYQILDNFLKRVIAKNANKELQTYIYLSKFKKNITIYREKNNCNIISDIVNSGCIEYATMEELLNDLEPEVLDELKRIYRKEL